MILSEEQQKTSIYLLKFALEVIEDAGLENTKNKDNWIIGKDTESFLKELELE